MKSEKLEAIAARIASRDDSMAMNSACGEYNCQCHYDLPALVDALSDVDAEVPSDIEAALAELKDLFPNSMVFAEQCAGNSDSGVPDWYSAKVQVDGRVFCKAFLIEARQAVRDWKTTNE